MKNGYVFSKMVTGKSKCILNGIIVMILAVLAVLAFVCSRPGEWESEIPKYKMILEAGNVVASKNAAGSEQNITGGLAVLVRSAVSSQGIMKILLCLLSISNIILMQMRNENTLRILAEVVYTLAVTFSFGRWGIYMACVERGYEAVGGEYSLLFVACWVSGVSIAHFFDSLEGLKRDRDT